MRRLGLFIFLAGCGISKAPCASSDDCPAGELCWMPERQCSPAPSPSPRPRPDFAVEDAGADLAQVDLDAPDLAPPADLAPLPDLAPYPDLLPLPVYFTDPSALVSVQAILDAHTCARSGCHSAGDGLYVPFLIANPSTAAASHQNFVNFSAEAQAVVFSKLVSGSGTAHGGVMSGDADRKPCSSAAVEPCATLQRWYSMGAPEHS